MMNPKQQYFDEFGWATDEVLPGREAPMLPSTPLRDGQSWLWTGGEWVIGDREVAAPERELAEVQRQKIVDVRTWANNIIQAAKADTAQYEVDTWDTQRNEYTAWLASSKAPTPYLDALATARGIKREDMMAKVGRKIAAFAQIQGTQQALEKQVMSAMKVEDVDAVTAPI
jgi:hypothetical protein